MFFLFTAAAAALFHGFLCYALAAAAALLLFLALLLLPLLFWKLSYRALGVDVADISGNTGCHADIVEGELADTWVELQEKGERLTDTTGGTEDDDLGELLDKHRVSSCLLAMRLGRPRKLDEILTLLAVAEKARRWKAPPRTDWVTLRAANMMKAAMSRVGEVVKAEGGSFQSWIQWMLGKSFGDGDLRTVPWVQAPGQAPNITPLLRRPRLQPVLQHRFQHSIRF